MKADELAAMAELRLKVQYLEAENAELIRQNRNLRVRLARIATMAQKGAGDLHG